MSINDYKIRNYRAYGMTKKAIAARMHISDRRVAAYLDAKEECKAREVLIGERSRRADKRGVTAEQKEKLSKKGGRK